MPMISFSEKDLLRSKVVKPAWYRMVIEDCEEKIASGGDSTNYNMDGTILFNADNGDKEFAGVPVGGPGSWAFNSKAMGFAVGFFEALGVKPETGKRYDLGATKGKTIDVWVEPSEFEGRIRNKVTHKYRAPREQK